MKLQILLVLGILIIVLVSGCTQLVKNESPAQNNESSASQPSNQTIISGLMGRLNSNVMNYEGSFEELFSYGSYAAHSAESTSSYYNITIDIEVQNNVVLNYSITHVFDGNPLTPEEIEARNYYEYYDRANQSMCIPKLIKPIIKTTCYLSKDVIPQTVGKMMGCRVVNLSMKNIPGKYQYFRGVNTQNGDCICNGKPIPIESTLPCADEEINASDFNFNDNPPGIINIYTNFYPIIYYNPENKTGFCFYFAIDKKGQVFAFQCGSNSILIPAYVNESGMWVNFTDVTGLKCQSPGIESHCDCISGISSGCSPTGPLGNFDTETKSSILSYLTRIEIKSISEEDNEFGHCYNFTFDGLIHSFCFNQQGLITFAQWGEIRTEDGSSDYNINKITKIS